MASIGEEKVVCVTGASGFIASWLVKLLLLKGYTVQATVRDPSALMTNLWNQLTRFLKKKQEAWALSSTPSK